MCGIALTLRLNPDNPSDGPVRLCALMDLSRCLLPALRADGTNWLVAQSPVRMQTFSREAVSPSSSRPNELSGIIQAFLPRAVAVAVPAESHVVSVSPGAPTALARAWLWLGIMALIGSGLLALLLVFSRTPGIQDVFPLKEFFRSALIARRSVRGRLVHGLRGGDLERCRWRRPGMARLGGLRPAQPSAHW